ncbi:DUF6283 family protein [Streptomyces sp. CG1]|uniref:DUF6283 family protein n=1 Tax=Streptomyces sp. CG1 TaxID=1287523 RepID=UPI0034E1F4A2
MNRTGCTAEPHQPPRRDQPGSSRPYRRTPSGVRASEEYEKLRRYDAPTPDHAAALFQCRQADVDSEARRICAGWAGCHDVAHLLALRTALLDGHIDASTTRPYMTVE